MFRFLPYDWTPADMIGGDLALDFVNTVSYWEADPADRLGDMEALMDWAAAAGVINGKQKSRMKRAINQKPDAARRLYKKADALRAALWRIFKATQEGRKVDAAHLLDLRAWTERAARFRCLKETDEGFALQWADDAPVLEIPLLAVAVAAEALLLDGPLHRLHRCGGDNCEWMFLDTSKNGRRRWCDMKTCGNEAKVKKFRSRRKAAAA